ncbi:MAG TPA: hypothetical protein VM900_13330 [Sphingomonas sp.]|nr:hypothetical protein [Sphingomonas sp.]
MSLTSLPTPRRAVIGSGAAVELFPAYAATSPESVSPGAVRSDVALPAFRAGRDPPFT